MDEALDRFTEAFNGPVFNDIIKSAQTDKLNRIYFDDFLGDGDFTISGSPIVSIMTSCKRCCKVLYVGYITYLFKNRGRRGRDRMIVRFIATFAISAYQ